ncbi:Glu/Leu/Phe/Val dehydrogenase dimerization domain-containing protein [Arthrobacter sp. SLBN-53]|uniref:Glu/Leu/Phe/Val dehydrogenase dimerization domain-containing protein n=1 Tax=Arthrobacter sp. SLBN-53 TaxID=2768412 RepID=UPI0011545DD3|nr:Glu/Leu/Phe/Val dehydrogenase dimerization domain-containing protein [Arthrobacter sp. SLBN-53]TQK30967.1 glutamate dehydrogenase (NAD(P)+) [Arthrobacter sp. SLBN-53]
MSLSLPNALGANDSVDDAAVFEATWTDPQTGARGYLVLDRLVRGVSSGGLRMRKGCTLDEVRGLARGMTLKEAIHYEDGAHYVPLGGAKGGIDFDSADPEADAVLFRYLEAMKPLIEQRWTMGEDLGVRQETVDKCIAQLGLNSSVDAAYRLLEDKDAATERMRTAFGTDVDGVKLDELVGGYGVAEAALAAMAERGLEPEGASVFVQGFGSMGGATARYLHRAGVRVVGIADVHGVVANPAGLDVERLLLTRTPSGAVDREQLRAEDTELAGDQWLAVPADVLVPAATSYCINADNQSQVGSALVVEAANMPVLPDAEAEMTARGIVVVPDFVANSATNAWWWWVLFGDIDGTATQSFDKISRRMRELSAEMFALSRERGVSARAAAYELATQRLEKLTSQYPS